MIHSLPPPNGLAVQLRPTALTVNAWGTASAARTVPRIDWTELLGVSCNRLLDGALHTVAGVGGGFGELLQVE